ncbi:MAG: hypothetical protein AB1646_26790 [Thermodesulfobacteriota bacterium]
MGKIKKPDKKPRGNIPRKTDLKDRYLAFSFKHLDLQARGDFSLAHSKDGYAATLLERLRDMSSMTVDEFHKNRRSLRAHAIDWGRTSQPDGFLHLNEQLRNEPPWQFQLTSNEHGRVHGFFVGNIFYVVWLDPDHRLYPGK